MFSTKSSCSCRIKCVFNECGKFVENPKGVGNLMNKSFVNIADKLLKERKGVIGVKNDELFLVQ